jgi:hypothetical protein
MINFHVFFLGLLINVAFFQYYSQLKADTMIIAIILVITVHGVTSIMDIFTKSIYLNSTGVRGSIECSMKSITRMKFLT